MRHTFLTLMVAYLISSCSKNDRVVRYEGYNDIGPMEVEYTNKNGVITEEEVDSEWAYEFDARKGDAIYLQPRSPGSIVKLYVDNVYIDSSARGDFVIDGTTIVGYIGEPIEIILE